MVKSTNDTELCGNFLLFPRGEHLSPDPNHGNRDRKSKLISVDLAYCSMRDFSQWIEVGDRGLAVDPNLGIANLTAKSAIP